MAKLHPSKFYVLEGDVYRCQISCGATLLYRATTHEDDPAVLTMPLFVAPDERLLYTRPDEACNVGVLFDDENHPYVNADDDDDSGFTIDDLSEFAGDIRPYLWMEIEMRGGA